MIRALVALSAMIGFTSTAAASVFVSLGLNSRFDKASNDVDVRSVSGHVLALGYRWEHWAVHLERFAHETRSGQSPLGLSHSYEEWMAWARVFPKSFSSFAPFIAGGLGIYRERVTVRFREESRRGESRAEAQAAGGLGVEWRISRRWLVDVEGRMHYPLPEEQLEFSVLGRLNLVF